MNYESIYLQFVEAFNKANETTAGTGYYVVGLFVPMKLLYDLYNKFMKDGIAPIEEIPEDKKRKYFNIASVYYDQTPERIKASKAAYVLDLLTSND